MLKVSFLFVLLSVVLSSAALRADDDADLQELTNRHAPEAVSADPTADDGDLAEEAMKLRRSQQRAQNNIQKANEALMIHQQLEQLTKDGWSAAKVMDQKVLEVLQKLLATGVLSNQPREAIKAHLQERLKGSRVEVLVKRFPVLLEIMTDLMRDKDALPGLIRILGKRDALRKYALIWLAILVFSFIFRRKVVNKATQTMGFFKRNFIGLGVTLFFTSVSLIIFYVMFRPDIHPTFAIVGKHLFGVG